MFFILVTERRVETWCFVFWFYSMEEKYMQAKREDSIFFSVWKSCLLEYKVRIKSVAKEYIRKEKRRMRYVQRVCSIWIWLRTKQVCSGNVLPPWTLEGNRRQGGSLEGNTLRQLHVLVEPVGRTKDDAQLWILRWWGGNFGGRARLGTLQRTGQAGIQGNGKD